MKSVGRLIEIFKVLTQLGTKVLRSAFAIIVWTMLAGSMAWIFGAMVSILRISPWALYLFATLGGFALMWEIRRELRLIWK
jgi:hypothetical protein